MFNYSAEQLFTIAPRGTGGGVLSMALSLDNSTAALNFTNRSVERKIIDWNEHLKHPKYDAHLYGFNNIGQPLHTEHMRDADESQRYIHKAHFFEIYKDRIQKFKGPLTGVGIYFTPNCIENMMRVRPWMKDYQDVDMYQTWVYSNLHQIMKDFYGISVLHTIPFSDMLDAKKFCEHIKFCTEIHYPFSIDMSLCKKVITDWQTIIVPRPRTY